MTRSHRPLLLLAAAFVLPAAGCSGRATTPATEHSEASPPKVAPHSPTAVNAGDVDYAKPRDYTFVIGNGGESPLDLTLAKKSCSCADVTMPGPIPPGGEGKVVVKWAPIPGNVGPYTVFADVRTNDPATKALRLEVKAHIRPLVHVFVEGKENNSFVDFGDDPVPPGQQRARELQVFSTKLDHFKLDAKTALPGFDIKQTELKPGSPVEGARGGYALELRTTDQLPYGYVRTELHLTLRDLGNNEPERTVTIPVYAVVGNAIFSIGRPGLFLFRKPNITDEDTARLDVTFILPQAQKERVEVMSFEPKFLKVDEPESVGRGKWRITVHIPKDDPEAAKYQPDPPMEGQVVLKVAGLDRPVPIRVKWDPLPK